MRVKSGLEPPRGDGRSQAAELLLLSLCYQGGQQARGLRFLVFPHNWASLPVHYYFFAKPVEDLVTLVVVSFIELIDLACQARG